MSKVMEERINEAIKEASKEITKKNSLKIAKNLILNGKLSLEDIAECSGLTVDEVNKLAKKAKPAQ